MNTKHREGAGNGESNGRGELLSAADVGRYLDLLARSLQEEKTGNPSLSGELRNLGEMLRAHGSRPIMELSITDKRTELPFVWEPRAPSGNARNGKPINGKLPESNGNAKAAAPRSGKSAPPLPDDLKSLSREELERMLKDDALTKRQVAEIGHARFGISMPSLLRARKDAARKTILSALRNEKSMHIVAEQARRAGEMRSA